MDNYDISDALGIYAKLAELHDENPFKVKAFASAAFNLKKVKEPLKKMDDAQILALPGVGKSVVGVLRNMLDTDTFPELDAMLQKTPPGVLQMLKIKGLGPKKVQGIWRNMGVESVEDLFDACRENRLVEQPGFGLKTQNEVIKAIEFSWGALGKFHYARVEGAAQELMKSLESTFPHNRHEFTGAFRRRLEVLEEIELLTTCSSEDIEVWMSGMGLQNVEDRFVDSKGYPFIAYHCDEDTFEKVWFETTATSEHLDAVGYDDTWVTESEEEIYEKAGLPWMEPELRENADQTLRVREGKITELLEFADLKGSLHNHSTWSDGLHSLEEMAVYCKSLGYEYLGICDHSRSAGYANGLNVERVLKQHAEIEELNRILAPFKILKGIESDILGDGSLDYEPEILSEFDLVVASVHSNLKMTEDVANQRLKRAIENPYTHILGHPTGRLLLVRQGYPINHTYIIDACAANGVAIELNANPYRLDLDWRWIGYALEKGVMISINPDAHEKHAYHDMYYGTLVARKGGLSADMTLNALGLVELENWLKNKRSVSLNEHL